MISRAEIEDAGDLAGLAIKMWEDHDPKDLEEEFRRLVMDDEAACFIKYIDGKTIGFTMPAAP